eukprot:164856_1
MTAKVLCMVLFIWSAYGRDKIPPCAHGVTKNELGKCGGIGFMSKRTCRTKGRKAYGYQCRILKNGGCPDYHSKGGMGYSQVKSNVLRGFTSPNGITFDVCNYVKACTCDEVKKKGTRVTGPPAVSGGANGPPAVSGAPKAAPLIAINGKNYDAESINAFFEVYTAEMKKHFPKFGFLSLKDESQHKADAFNQKQIPTDEGAKSPKNIFELAAIKGPKSIKEWVDALPNFNPANYVIVSIGTTSTFVLFVKDDTGGTSSTAVKSAKSLDMGPKFENFGVRNDFSADTVDQFVQTLKDKVLTLGFKKEDIVYFFWMNAIGYGLNDGVNFVNLGDPSTELNNKLKTTPKTALARNMCVLVAAAWNKKPPPLNFKAVIKNRALEPTVKNEWTVVETARDTAKAVLDISGSAVAIHKGATGQELAKLKKLPINKEMKEAVQSFLEGGVKSNRVEAEAKAKALAVKMMGWVNTVAGPGKANIPLTDIDTVLETGYIRSFHDALAKATSKVSAHRVNEDYYDERYYEEGDRYSDQDEDDTGAYNEHDVVMFRDRYTERYLAAMKRLKEQRKVYNAGKRLRNYYSYYNY